MNAWKIILATILIFGTGMVTGGLVMRSVNRNAASGSKPEPLASAQGFSPDVIRLDFLKRAESALHLTPEQHETIDRILQDSQDRMKKYMNPFLPSLNEEVKKTKDEFRAVLTPEQLKCFDELSMQPQRPADFRRFPPPRERPPGERPQGDRPGEKRFGRTNGPQFKEP